MRKERENMARKVLDSQRIIVSFPDYDGAGIYMIQNTTTGRVYIGSSKHVLQRVKAHDQTFRKRTCNAKFLEDIDKGYKFACRIVEKYSKITRCELRDREEYFVKKYNAQKEGYNTAYVATYDPRNYWNNKPVLDWLNEEM